MFRFLLKRILTAIPVFLGALLAVFILLTYIPGSRLGYMPIAGNGDLLDHLFTLFHVPANVFTRYLRYIYDVITKLHFASGFHHRDLSLEVLTRARLTLFLTFLAFLLIVLVGIPLGTYAAGKHGKWQDHLISVISLVLSSIPPFCLAIFLAIVFCVTLRLLPVFGMNGPKNFILPTVTIGASGLARTIQTVRANVIEAMHRPYIRTLRSHGVKERKILFNHALKNSMIPTVSIIREMTAEVFVSTFIAEWFYAIPGIGYYLIQAVNARDYGVVLACTAVTAVLILVFGIISDLLYYLLEPELRHREVSHE